MNLHGVTGKPTLFAMPDGFRDTLNWTFDGQNFKWDGGTLTYTLENNTHAVSASSGSGHITWPTDAPWPTTLPGAAA